jgi:hypothetical protein
MLAGRQKWSALSTASSIRQPPATARGARTRAALIAAVRKVFERDGYRDAKLSDFTKEAGCATLEGNQCAAEETGLVPMTRFSWQEGRFGFLVFYA